MTQFPRGFPTILQTFTILISSSFLWTCKATDSLPNYNLRCTTLDSIKTGFMITGATAGDQLGYPVSTAGDINKDGYDDILVGAYNYGSFKGAVYVIYGGPTSEFLNIDLSSTTLDPATTGFTITGSAANSYLGWSLSAAGDINKDGYDDIIVGAYGYGGAKGAAYVIYGGEKSSMSNLDLSTITLDPLTTGFMITGEVGGDWLGHTVSTAGDMNNDGYDDIIIGAHGKTLMKGAAYVIYGGAKSSMQNWNFGTDTLNPLNTGFMITGSAAGDRFAFWVGTAGDVNNDGYAEVVIGAPYRSSNKGAAYVIYGEAKSSMQNWNFGTDTLNPLTTGFIMTGESSSNYFGFSVSAAGDMNNDGYDDIIIGAQGYSSSKGRAYVIYGGSKSSMPNIDLSTAPLSPLSTGFTITGNANLDNFARFVRTAGDVNNDGYDDIIIGAYGPSSNTGAAYVIYGRSKSSMSNIDLSSAALDPATTGFTVTGKAAGDYLGIAVSSAGDVNNDGYDDIIIGAYTANGNRGIAYVIHNACLTANCDSCISRSVCDKCTSPYLLFDSWCIPACPKRTYSSSVNCKRCPVHCSSCTSQESCQICDQGYSLLDSLCTSPSSLHTESSSLQTISSVTKGMGSVVSIGGSISPLTALVSKIVQNTRYMNLTVTDELAEIYQTWDTDLISWEVPNALAKFDHFETVPTLFSRYEIDSPFLVNFWPTLVNIGVGLATFITCFVLRKLFERSESNKGWIYSVLQKLIAGSFNFTLVQAYACLDDILFYLVLDAKTNPFNTFFCWASLFFAIGFLALGCFLIWLNLKTVKQYQALKKDTIALEVFNEKNKYWELFYSDFNDYDFWSQSALALFLARSTLSSLIIAVLYEYPVMQAVYLIIIDGAIILYLYFEKPFVTFQSTLCQYYYEIITLLVHICTCILSIQNPSDGLKTFLSNSIIYLNTALVTGSIGFMFLEIYKTIRRKMKKRKQYEEIAIQTLSNNDLDPQNTTRLESDSENLEQIIPPENLHLLSGLPQQDSNSSLPGLNIQPSNNSGINIDDGSLVSDLDRNSRIHQQRGYADPEVDLTNAKIFHKSSIPQETVYL